ncbi:uncharacterized protein LOC123531028 [Mercenaria mercenaria]|uniref:uncharacterized protein LOC123531028 n=1 Tax=Mercenaria mercenaria TaxID=6596 RepID=UPI00234E8810|nr:uncharacterized protein LOC123531028 [Mercenaria mercenaria]
MEAKYLEHEMEPLDNGNLNDVQVSVENPEEVNMAKLYKIQCSIQDAAKKTMNTKCWLAKTCLKCVALVAAVFTFIYLTQSINKIQNEVHEDDEKQPEHSNQLSLPQALKSSKFGISLMNSKSADQSAYFGQFPPDQQDIGNTDGNRMSADDRAYLKHYFNIGMREDDMMQDCHNSHMKHSFPDIDYAFLGYDIFRGYPLADGHDPGFTYPIFAADYSHGKQTADCRYSVPKGFVVIPDVSCVTTFTSDVIQTTTELVRGLSVNAGASGGGFGVAFSASAGYKQALTDLSSSESVYIVSTAHCNYYISKFKKETPPPFTPMFFDWIRKLNSSTSNDTYSDFFDTFGTHFAKEITFGARFTYEHKMKSSLYKTKREQGVNVAAQASYSGIFSVSGGFSLTSEQRQEASEFSKSVETKTITVGAAPPANGDAMTWASTVQNNPVPAEYILEPIEMLFQEEYMGNLGVDYQKMSFNIEKLKMNYYNRLIAKKYKIDIENQSNRWITKTLLVDTGSQYGTWSPPQFCPLGTFAKGFSSKLQNLHGPTSDGAVVDGVRLMCADKLGKLINGHMRTVQSGEGHRGEWTANIFCPQADVTLFLQQFALKVQQKEYTRDLSVNGIHFSCRDMHWTRHSITGSPLAGQTGTWSERCPLESAICGMQTRIVGDHIRGGNTTLNDIRFYCCGDDSAYLDRSVIF